MRPRSDEPSHDEQLVTFLMTTHDPFVIVTETVDPVDLLVDGVVDGSDAAAPRERARRVDPKGELA